MAVERCVDRHSGLPDNGYRVPTAPVTRSRRPIVAGPNQAGHSQLPRFLFDVALDQAQHCLRPGLVLILFRAVPAHSSPENSQDFRRGFGRCEVHEKWHGPMTEFTSDMGGTNLVADSLDPGFERDPGKLPVAPFGHTVPNGNPDVLHDIIQITNTTDSCQAGYDVAPNALHCDHDLVDGDDALPRHRRGPQRDINCPPGVTAGLI
ncbi:hypothetical protein J2S98_003496 [Arthrobacter oryzae]|nr:hypothetical protein [Arthrobacter oryzae]